MTRGKNEVLLLCMLSSLDVVTGGSSHGTQRLSKALFDPPSSVVKLKRVRGGQTGNSDLPFSYTATTTTEMNQPSHPDYVRSVDGAPMMNQETFQDRVDAWKRQQQEQYSSVHYPPNGDQQASLYNNHNDEPVSVRDAEGRMKLITASVSKGSRALIFFILLWRDVHLYEVADTALSGISRLMVVLPLCLLFMANLAGVVASFTSPSHSSKKRLKAILNLDKLVEVFLIIYNFARLTLFPPKLIPREVYIANTLHSVFFILQSQAFTRVTWDQQIMQTPQQQQASYGGGYGDQFYGQQRYEAEDEWQSTAPDTGTSSYNY